MGKLTDKITWLGMVAVALLCAALCEPVSAADPGPRTLTNNWTVSVGSHSDCIPAIATDGTVYFANFDGKLWAITPKGEIKWIFQTGSVGRSNIEIHSSPTLASDGSICFGCRDNRVYAVTQEGRLKWAFETEGWVDSSPALGADDSVYAGSWDGKLYAFSPTGSKKWEFRTGGPVVSSPAITTQGLILFGSHDGKFYAVQPDGKKAWEYATGAQIISSPALGGDGAIYFTSVNGMFHALNPDGTLRWTLKTGGITESSPVIGQDGTIILGVNKNVWMVSPEGKKIRDYPATSDAYQEPIYATPCALADNTVIIVSGYGLLSDYDASAKMIWKHYVYGFGAGGPGLAPDGSIYIATGIPGVGTGLTALSQPGRLARSSWPRFHGPTGTGRAAQPNT